MNLDQNHLLLAKNHSKPRLLVWWSKDYRYPFVYSPKHQSFQIAPCLVKDFLRFGPGYELFDFEAVSVVDAYIIIAEGSLGKNWKTYQQQDSLVPTTLAVSLVLTS